MPPFVLYLSLDRTWWTDGRRSRKEWRWMGGVMKIKRIGCYTGSNLSPSPSLPWWVLWADGGTWMLATSCAHDATVNEAKNSNTGTWEAFQRGANQSRIQHCICQSVCERAFGGTVKPLLHVRLKSGEGKKTRESRWQTADGESRVSRE